MITGGFVPQPPATFWHASGVQGIAAAATPTQIHRWFLAVFGRSIGASARALRGRHPRRVSPFQGLDSWWGISQGVALGYRLFAPSGLPILGIGPLKSARLRFYRRLLRLPRSGRISTRSRSQLRVGGRELRPSGRALGPLTRRRSSVARRRFSRWRAARRLRPLRRRRVPGGRPGRSRRSGFSGGWRRSACR
ncbi:MAG: hypothetical protein RLZZ15_3470 [Verrucomicrobiota bacterium]